MFVLDSDTYTHLLREHPRVANRMEQAYAQHEPVATTIITKIEILQGHMSALLKADTDNRFLLAQQKLITAEEALQRIRVMPLDRASLHAFAQLDKARGLKKIGRADLLIASIVRAHQATLVTRNLKHFKLIPQLKLENWVD